MDEVPAPIISINDLQSFVIDRLNSLERTGNTSWHGDKLPPNEVYIKIGGDHGGRGICSTFKQALQVINTSQPNSKHNTCAVCVFAAKDYRQNLERGLKEFSGQLQDLKLMKWRGKSVRVFHFGDYDYLCNVYGLSGAAGVHPCLWCTVTKEDMQLPRSSRKRKVHVNRCLQTIKMDYRRFVAAGKIKKNAQKFNNVINEPILDIDISHVCPPDLHILLGLVKRHHELLEEECHAIDLKIARLSLNKDQPENVTHEYSKYLQQLHEIHETKENLRKTTDEIKKRRHQMTSKQIAIHEGNQKKLELQLHRSRKLAILPKRQGPVAANLDTILQKHKIHPQAYHGRSFIGNHCHRYLKEDVFVDLLKATLAKIQDLTDDKEIILMGRAMGAKYCELNTLFAEVHKCISHSRFIDATEIPKIEAVIDEYMNFFRTHFEDTNISPKMHILEDHIIPFIQRWHFGLGLFDEQGGETIHKEFNHLANRAWGAHSEVDKLRILFQERLLETSVDLQKGQF